MQKVQFSNDYPQLRIMHCPGTVENLTEHLQNITFIKKSIPVSHAVFKIKSTEMHAIIYDKVKIGYWEEFNSFVFYLHCFIIRSCDLKKKYFSSMLTITDKHKTSVLGKMCSKKYFQTGF